MTRQRTVQVMRDQYNKREHRLCGNPKATGQVGLVITNSGGWRPSWDWARSLWIKEMVHCTWHLPVSRWKRRIRSLLSTSAHNPVTKWRRIPEITNSQWQRRCLHNVKCLHPTSLYFHYIHTVQPFRSQGPALAPSA